MAKKRANGEGTIYYLENQQKWCAEITWFDNGGNKRKKSWKSKKQTEVKTKLAEFKKQLLLNGTEIAKENKTFRQFSEEWLTVVLKPKLKPTSYGRKVCTLENQVYKHILEKKNEEYLHNSKVQTSPLMCFGIGLHLFFIYLSVVKV